MNYRGLVAQPFGWELRPPITYNGPKEGHLLGLAGSCWNDGEQRATLMLIEVRGGASRCL